MRGEVHRAGDRRVGGSAAGHQDQRGTSADQNEALGLERGVGRQSRFPPRTGLHCCRHLFASALIRFGESVKTVQHLMGHSSPTVTLNVYGHLWPDFEDRARQAIEEMFEVPAGGNLAVVSEATEDR